MALTVMGGEERKKFKGEKYDFICEKNKKLWLEQTLFAVR